MSKARDIANSTKTLDVDGGTIKLDGNYPTNTGNVALGNAALDSLTTGGNNTAIGRDAMTANTSGGTNVALGGRSLEANTTADNNVAVGYGATLTNTTGANNVGIGYNALLSNTTASNNTAVGYQASYSGTTADNNVAIGLTAMYSNTTGDRNVAIGTSALNAFNVTNNADTYNTAVGALALYSTTTGTTNTAFGGQALQNNTTASSNTAVGYQAGYSNTVGTRVAYFGKGAGKLSTASDNTFIGQRAGETMTTGYSNTILGRYNGNQGGLDIRTSNNNIVLSDGDGNPRLQIGQYGELAARGQQTTNADFNTSYSGGDVRRCLLWHQAGSSTGRPRMLLESHTSGAVIDVNNTFNSSSTRSFLRFYRRGVQVGRIEGNDTTTTYVTSSDYRLKENVIDLTGATDRLKQLEPKRFNFIADADTTVDGFLAHEVQSVVPEAITGTHNEVETWEEADDLPDGVSLGDNKLDENGNTIPKYQGIDHGKLVPLLVATIQELEARITALENA